VGTVSRHPSGAWALSIRCGGGGGSGGGGGAGLLQAGLPAGWWHVWLTRSGLLFYTSTPFPWLC
jgi:hypothetical protein